VPKNPIAIWKNQKNNSEKILETSILSIKKEKKSVLILKKNNSTCDSKKK